MSRLEKKEDPTTRVTVRIPKSDLDRFDEAVDHSDHGSRSDAMRHLIHNWIDDDAELEVPANDRLARAYRTIATTAGPRCRLKSDTAISMLAEQFAIPKQAVRPTLLDPLEDESWIRPHWGWIIVRGEQ